MVVGSRGTPGWRYEPGCIVCFWFTFGRRGSSFEASFNSVEVASGILRAAYEYLRPGGLEDSAPILYFIDTPRTKLPPSSHPLSQPIFQLLNGLINAACEPCA